MDPKITISKRAFYSLISDYEGPQGPDDGPINEKLARILDWIRHHGWPPIPDPEPEPWYRQSIYELNLQLPKIANPRQFGAITGRVIASFIEQHQLASASSGTENGEATKVISNRIAAMSEAICGNEVRGIYVVFPPAPPPGGGDEPRPIIGQEIIAASIQFDRAAQRLANHPLQAALIKAADLTLNVGLERLQVRR